MKEMTVKKIVLSCISALASILAIVGLAFNVISTSAAGIIAIKESGYKMLGFNSLTFTDEFAAFMYIFGALGYVILLCGVAGLILSVVGLFMFSAKRANKICMAFTIVYASLYLLYMICGIVATVLITNSINTDMEAGSMASQVMQITTLSFMPFVFAAVCLIAYVICFKVIKAGRILGSGNYAAGEQVAPYVSGSAVVNGISADGVAAVNCNSRMSDVQRERAVVELLRMYKEAMTDGVITLEEYEIKKRQWLNIK